MRNMDKTRMVRELLSRLAEMRDIAREAEREYKNASVDSPGAMQSHSDTSKFQFGKLAEDAAARAEKLEQAVAALGKLPEPGGPAALGSLIEAEEDGARKYFLLVPDGAGGQEFEAEGVAVQAVAVSSPIGRALIGHALGEEVVIKLPAGERRMKVVGVS